MNPHRTDTAYTARLLMLTQLVTTIANEINCIDLFVRMSCICTRHLLCWYKNALFYFFTPQASQTSLDLEKVFAPTCTNAFPSPSSAVRIS